MTRDGPNVRVSLTGASFLETFFEASFAGDRVGVAAQPHRSASASPMPSFMLRTVHRSFLESSPAPF
jgi:hypothetical protein